MRRVSADLAHALNQREITPTITFDAWGGGRHLGVIDEISSGSWSLTDEADVEVPGSISFDVPNTPRWSPTHADHPLRPNGVRIRAQVGVGNEQVTWGWYRLDDTRPAGWMRRCTGRGLLSELDRQELQAPYQAPAAQGRSLVLFDLLLGVLPYAIVGLSDEPGGGTWERKRIEGFWDTVRAWRGRAYVDSSATVVICPAWDDANPGPHVWALTDGDGGNLSSFEPAETHQPYNAFVMTATAENQDAITETWYLPDTELAWGGLYGFRPGFISGAHLPRDPWALRYLAEVETRRQLRFWDTYTFETPFDPRPEVGDVVKVSSTRQGVSGLARITALTLTRSTLAGKVTML